MYSMTPHTRQQCQRRATFFDDFSVQDFPDTKIIQERNTIVRTKRVSLKGWKDLKT